MVRVLPLSRDAKKVSFVSIRDRGIDVGFWGFLGVLGIIGDFWGFLGVFWGFFGGFLGVFEGVLGVLWVV